jgi:hypothetical protein
MDVLNYIGCIVKTVLILALVANDRAGFAFLLCIFVAYVYLPKMIRDFRSRRQCVASDRPPDTP